MVVILIHLCREFGLLYYALGVLGIVQVRVRCLVLHTGPLLARAVCNSSDFIKPTSSAALNGFGMTRSYA
jgi:hypothetical protein